MNKHHDEAKKMALEHKHQLEDLKTGILASHLKEEVFKISPSKMADVSNVDAKKESDNRNQQAEIIQQLKESEVDLRNIISDYKNTMI